ncbi:hypothetical protein ACSNOK_04555 [Streptomyces sp. URMC 126]|uniref:hypothetical protein n=1 Tax=Streptomyces sp. URMC 126 TaxID=3423401 RepID=UPI003F1D0060
MKRKIASAVASVGVVFAAASTVSVVTAAPASATTDQCVSYLQSKNYVPTNQRVDACYTAGHFIDMRDKGIRYQSCRFSLEGSGVRYSDAVTACSYAQTNV